MSHQVLARKWRPGRFEDLVGQPHVVRALMNALTSGRLHHAYLFSGTRGVGKTTVARILARCLNCETGITATPCGECRSCVEISEGRHLDLIEVDAASRTRVDDTRELLDNVSYAPVSGRFKVYLIDEVHMLSEKSFNALLKTLEEPPPHVMFLLATTDPQKLPVTVLSRCLQFNLKPMPAPLIAEHLGRVLAAEEVSAEPGALLRLAEAAEGSMRDALSLTDQAIAYGGTGLTESEVCDMIGLLPRTRLTALLDDVWAGQGARMLDGVAELEKLAPDWSRLLEELAALVHGVAVDQILAEEHPDQDDLIHLWRWEAARRESPEEIQLSYEILVRGARDLPFAPDPRIGVEMTLLRLLAFRPDPLPAAESGQTPVPSARASAKPARSTREASGGRRSGAPEPVAAGTAAPPLAAPAAAPRVEAPVPSPVAPPRVETRSRPERAQESARVSEPAMLDWHAFARDLPSGPARELALHADLIECAEGRVVIAVPPAQRMLGTERTRKRLSEALSRILQGEVRLELREQSTPSDTTPAARLAADAAELQARAEAEVNADPVIQTLRDTFGAEVTRVSLEEKAGEPGVDDAGVR
jgi:DNA polymerase-3 subunit gamma/tau